MHNTTDIIQPGPIDQHQLAVHHYECHHIFPDGARCGSPALRNENRCYYHHETRKPVSNPRDRNARTNTFELPFPDSRTAVQSALGDLMVRIASNDIDPRRAGLLLYCLQLAQANLKASELAVAHEAQQHEAQQTTEGAPGFSPVNDAPVAQDSSLGLSNEVQTEVSFLEDFAQKTGEGIGDPKPTPDSLSPTPSPLVILNHSNAKQTNCPHHPRRLGLPCRDPRKRHRTGPQAHLRQASGDLPQHAHPRQ